MTIVLIMLRIKYTISSSFTLRHWKENVTDFQISFSPYNHIVGVPTYANFRVKVIKVSVVQLLFFSFFPPPLFRRSKLIKPVASVSCNYRIQIMQRH